MQHIETLLKELVLDKRTVFSFEEKEISNELIHKLYELTSLGATAFNAQPARFLFIKSKEAKERLKPFLSPGNVEKTMKAPLTVVVAQDNDFHELLPITFPVADVKGIFQNNENLIQTTGLRNSSLAGGYLISAAHLLGLDTGGMSGFNNEALDKEFFSNTNIKSNFLINIGYGIYDNIPPRLPRLSFEQASQIL